MLMMKAQIKLFWKGGLVGQWGLTDPAAMFQAPCPRDGMISLSFVWKGPLQENLKMRPNRIRRFDFVPEFNPGQTLEKLCYCTLLKIPRIFATGHGERHVT